MNIMVKSMGTAFLASALTLSAAGQALPDYRAIYCRAQHWKTSGLVRNRHAATPITPAVVVATHSAPANDSDVKFDLRNLMEILRDRRHEGWVLAAYPDPKTGHPLIGAGFSLDLPERAHPQPDQLNPHAFKSNPPPPNFGSPPASIQIDCNPFSINSTIWAGVLSPNEAFANGSIRSHRKSATMMPINSSASPPSRPPSTPKAIAAHSTA